MTSTPDTLNRRIPDQAQLVSYLLGELSAPEQTAIEDALFDDEIWAAVQLAEDDVLVAYTRGRLDVAQREHVAARIAASPRLRARVDLYRDLHAIAMAKRRSRRRWRERVVVASVALAAVLAVLLVVHRGAERRSLAPPGTEVVAITLAPTTRAGEMSVVRVSGSSTLVLSVIMDAEEAFPRYRVLIRARGLPLWSRDDVVASEATLTLRVPASTLAEGVYEVEITGLGADGEAVRLGVRSFRVIR